MQIAGAAIRLAFEDHALSWDAAIEASTIDAADPGLKERPTALKNSRDRATGALAKGSAAAPVIDSVAVDRFTRLMREQLVSGDVAAGRASLASVVAAIIVSEDKSESSSSVQTTMSGSPLDLRVSPRPRFENLFRNGAQGRNRIISYLIEITPSFE